MLQVTYPYNLWNFVRFIRDSGHIYVQANVFTSSVRFTSVSFIVDTGAYITVLSRNRAKQIGLQLTGKYTANFTGFNIERGSDEAEIVIVPKFEIGKHFIEDVSVIVPIDDIVVPAVIGANILEYFNYTVDHDKDRIYFTKNPNPKPYIDRNRGIDLSCGRVLLQDMS